MVTVILPEMELFGVPSEEFARVGYDISGSWRRDGEEEANLEEMEYFLPFPPLL